MMGAAIRGRRFRADQRGATSIEFAILATPFFLSVLIVAEVGLEMMQQATLDAAVQKVSENLHTSRFTPPPTATSLRKAVCEIFAQGRDCPDTFAVELTPLPPAAAPGVPPANSVDLGAPNDMLILRARTEFVSVAAVGTLRRDLYAARLVRRP
jgi:Flp pilus assembly pilin Flp